MQEKSLFEHPIITKATESNDLGITEKISYLNSIYNFEDLKKYSDSKFKLSKALMHLIDINHYYIFKDKGFLLGIYKVVNLNDLDKKPKIRFFEVVKYLNLFKGIRFYFDLKRTLKCRTIFPFQLNMQYSYAYLSNLIVKKEMQGKGIAKELILSAILNSSEDFMIVSFNENDTVATKLFTMFNFRFVGSYDTKVKKGEKVTKVFLILDIKQFNQENSNIKNGHFINSNVFNRDQSVNQLVEESLYAKQEEDTIEETNQFIEKVINNIENEEKVDKDVIPTIVLENVENSFNYQNESETSYNEEDDTDLNKYSEVSENYDSQHISLPNDSLNNEENEEDNVFSNNCEKENTDSSEQTTQTIQIDLTDE